MKKTIGDLPDLAKSLAKLKLLIDLGECAAKKDTIFGGAILKAISDKQPADRIIEWVKSQAKDEPTIMFKVIGEELTNRILKFS